MKKHLITILVISALLMLSACSDECRHSDISRTLFEPTCSDEGYTLAVCDGCGYSYKCDFSAPIGHTPSLSVTEPDCDGIGYTEYACACGFSYLSDYTSPTGHTLVETRFAPSCTEAGYSLFECDCGYSYTAYTTPPHGHELTETVHAPSCTEAGYTEYSCKECSESYKDNLVLPLGHSFMEDIVYPTYTSTGYTHYKCSCGSEYNGSFVLSGEVYTGAFGVSDTPLAFGVDLSKWNGEVDFSDFCELGIDFVILKAGSAKGGIDPYFEANYKSAKAAGLAVGAYFYSYSTTIEGAIAEAELFCGMLSGKQFEYPIYFDLEDESQKELSAGLLTDICEAFIGEMQKNGYFCGLYVNHDWLENRLNTEKVVTYFDVWFARWTVSGTPDWKETFGQKTGLWQYTDSGALDGFEGKFDLNVAFKDYPEIIKKFGLNGF